MMVQHHVRVSDTVQVADPRNVRTDGGTSYYLAFTSKCGKIMGTANTG